MITGMKCPSCRKDVRPDGNNPLELSPAYLADGQGKLMGRRSYECAGCRERYVVTVEVRHSVSADWRAA